MSSTDRQRRPSHYTDRQHNPQARTASLTSVSVSLGEPKDEMRWHETGAAIICERIHDDTRHDAMNSLRLVVH